MSEELYKKLITGIDAGNISTKVSYLNGEGNMEDFAIPTVIAKAPETTVDYGDYQEKDDTDEKRFELLEENIHIRVASPALDKDENNLTWFVGELAKNSAAKIQPVILENGDAEDKFSDSNRKVFLLPVLAGMAIAAIRNGERNVSAPLSIGLPSGNYLKKEQSLKQRFIGKHKITFIDGPFVDETVTIEIKQDEAQIHAESVTTALALKYDIQGNVLVNTKLEDTLQNESFTLADLGAGTSDKSVFNEKGLDKVMTRIFAEQKEGRLGTNVFIDKIIENVYNDPAFESQRKVIEELNDDSRKPAELTSREIFMKKIIKPVIQDAIKYEIENKGKNQELKFTFSWARSKNVDITKHVMEQMKAYAKAQLLQLESAWSTANTDHFIVVGGGVLFGYYGGLHQLKENGMIIPDLEKSQYFTSKSYCIANYLMSTVKLG